MGDELAHLVGKGGGAPFHLGGFQQMAAGLMEDHPAEAIGQHHRELASLHVVGIKHGGGAGAQVDGGGIDIPMAQIIGVVGGAVATAQAGTVITISG